MRCRYRSLDVLLPILWVLSAWLSIGAVSQVYGQATIPPAPSGLSNPCPEGEFQALPNKTCRTLDKSFGFDAAQFLENWGEAKYVLSSCNASALIRLLTQIDREGGTVTLPACTLRVDKTIRIPSHVLLQGQGAGKTKLVAADGFSDTMVQVRNASHVIVRDLTIDGSHQAHALASSWYADNVLFERLDAKNAAGNGIHFRYARRISIRYSSSHGHTKWHGIASKDCFPRRDDRADDLECREQFDAKRGDDVEAPGVLWSEDYAIYSNKLYGNGDYGLDTHASRGEIAGNLVVDNGRGAKFPDASRLWIHHNKIASNGGWYAFIYSTLDIDTRAPRQIAIYANEIGNNRFLQARFEKPASQIYLIYNKYSSGVNVFRNANASVFACPGSPDSNIFIVGRRLAAASQEQCRLQEIEDIFDANQSP